MIVKTNPKEFQNYLEDASHYKGNADKLFLPESEKEISEILAEHHAKKIPITVSGARTGLTGSAIPEGGSILATERLNQIKLIEEEKAIVHPGVSLERFYAEVKAKKLLYPPDPGEPRAFLGGTVATNASGPRSFKYGSTRNWVKRLRIVLPTGEILNVARGDLLEEHYRKIKIPSYSFSISKNAAGYFAKPKMDLIDLFIGSEGTLGVVSEIETVLLPLPRVFAMIFFFPDEKVSWNFVHEARLMSRISISVDPPTGIEARSFEYFDERALEVLRPAYPHIPRGAKAAIYIEQEFEMDEFKYVEAWLKLVAKYHGLASETWMATSIDQQEEFREFRHTLPMLVNEKLAKYGQVKIGTDTVLPDEHAQSFMEFQKNALIQAKLDFVTFGHIGDNHLHLNILPRNETERTNAKELYFKFLREAVRLGGTISGEHGIGKLKRPYFQELFPKQGIKEMIEIKKAFDPHLILNRGNLFPEEMII